MASYHEIPKPERPRGTDTERWNQIYRYLFDLAERLQNIINELAEEGVKKDGDVRQQDP